MYGMSLFEMACRRSTCEKKNDASDQNTNAKASENPNGDRLFTGQSSNETASNSRDWRKKKRNKGPPDQRNTTGRPTLGWITGRLETLGASAATRGSRI